MAVLIIPGAMAMLLLLQIRRSMGNPITGDEDTATTETTAHPERRESSLARLHGRLPREFWFFAAAAAAASGGLVTFAVISFHLTQDQPKRSQLSARAGFSIALEAAFCWACRSWYPQCRFWPSLAIR